jgi:hypothetical protein
LRGATGKEKKKQVPEVAYVAHCHLVARALIEGRYRATERQ